MKSKFNFFFLLLLLCSCKEEIKSSLKDKLNNDFKEERLEIQNKEDRFEIINSNFEFSTLDINSYNRYVINYRLELKNISQEVLIRFYYDFNYDYIIANFDYSGQKVFQNLTPSGGNSDFIPKSNSWEPQEVKILEGKLEFDLNKKFLENYFEFTNATLAISMVSENPLDISKRQEIKFDISDGFKSMLLK